MIEKEPLYGPVRQEMQELAGEIFSFIERRTLDESTDGELAVSDMFVVGGVESYISLYPELTQERTEDDLNDSDLQTSPERIIARVSFDTLINKDLDEMPRPYTYPGMEPTEFVDLLDDGYIIDADTGVPLSVDQTESLRLWLGEATTADRYTLEDARESIEVLTAGMDTAQLGALGLLDIVDHSAEFQMRPELTMSIFGKLLPVFLTSSGLDVAKISVFDLDSYQLNTQDPLSDEEYAYFRSFRDINTKELGIDLPEIRPEDVLRPEEAVQWTSPISGLETGIILHEQVAECMQAISQKHYLNNGRELVVEAGYRSEDGSTAMMIGFLSVDPDASLESVVHRVAKPGESSHAVNAVDIYDDQTGPIPDTNDPVEMEEYIEKYKNSELYALLKSEQEAGNIILPYLEGNQYGIRVETWHIEVPLI